MSEVFVSLKSASRNFSSLQDSPHFNSANTNHNHNIMSENRQKKQPVAGQVEASCITCSNFGHSWEECEGRCHHCGMAHYRKRCPSAMNQYPKVEYYALNPGQERATLAKLRERNMAELERVVALRTEVAMLEQLSKQLVALPGSPAAIAAAASEFTFRPETSIPDHAPKKPFKVLPTDEVAKLSRGAKGRYKKQLEKFEAGLTDLQRDEANVVNTDAATSGETLPEQQAQSRPEGDDTAQPKATDESTQDTPVTERQPTAPKKHDEDDLFASDNENDMDTRPETTG